MVLAVVKTLTHIDRALVLVLVSRKSLSCGIGSFGFALWSPTARSLSGAQLGTIGNIICSKARTMFPNRPVNHAMTQACT